MQEECRAVIHRDDLDRQQFQQVELLQGCSVEGTKAGSAHHRDMTVRR